jgi:WD40 repeat protein
MKNCTDRSTRKAYHSFSNAWRGCRHWHRAATPTGGRLYLVSHLVLTLPPRLGMAQLWFQADGRRGWEELNSLGIGWVRPPLSIMLCNESCMSGYDLRLEDQLTTHLCRDLRQNKPRWQNSENNDDITAIEFHPEKANILLAGGDDGLVSLFDTNIQEEEDSLVQAFNHGPIHKAGFVDQGAIYALSSDQNLAIHPVYDEGRTTEPEALRVGDLRPLVPCEYVIDLLHVGSDFVVAAGSHR